MFDAAGVSCEAVANLVKNRWEKLVWNIPFNGLCALTGKTVTELLAHGPSRDQVTAIMQEVIAGANAQCPAIPTDAESFIARMIELSEPMVGYRPSMMIDRLEGRPLELQAIYCIPLRRAAARGVEMPRVAMLHALLDLGERG
jgi:2-dehydropantoate 2-reductase